MLDKLIWISEALLGILVWAWVLRHPRLRCSGGWLIFAGLVLIFLHDATLGVLSHAKILATQSWLALALGAIHLAGIAFLLLGSIKVLVMAARMKSSSEERFYSLTRVAGDAIITIDDSSTVLTFNECAESMFGRSAETMIGKKMHSIIPERYRHQHDAGVAKISAKGGAPFSGKTRELYALRKDGSEFPIELTVATWTDDSGRRFFIGIIRDITERKRLEDELKRLATTDSMTGIYNRRRFTEILLQEMRRARRLERPLSLAMLDIDFFKRINDTYGHAAGDEVIKALARACVGEIREIDSVGRLGGEEFAILLPELNLAQAAEVAERIRKKIASLDTEHQQRHIRFTASLGVTALLDADSTIETVLGRADMALYRSKEGGRDRVTSA